MDILSINVIDVVIVLMILLGGVIGFKRGFFKELVMTVGYVLVIIISLILKNPIAEFLSLNLPFFNFGGNFEGLVVINILLYQLVAFILAFCVLIVIFDVLVNVTKVVEKLLDFTIILGAFSKILGAIVGLIEGYLLMYILCLLLSYPIFNQTVVEESKLKAFIIEHTPIISNLTTDLTDTVNEIVDLSKTDIVNNKDEFNIKAVDIMLKHKIVSVDYMDKLITHDKINVPGLGKTVNKYRG